MEMRYRESGELHLDFHGSMHATLAYIGQRFGREALREILRETAQRVYCSIYEKLKVGDLSELIEHWRYFMEREGAQFTINVTDDGVEMIVQECPAVRHLRTLGIEQPSEFFCDQTILLNEAWCEGTPFSATTIKRGCGSCIQTIARRAKEEGQA